MEKEKEAVEYIRNHCIVEDAENIKGAEVHNEFMKIAICAIEKQIQKKPILKNLDFLCPSCSEICGCKDAIVLREPKQCKSCKQKLDWSNAYG